MQDFGKYPHLRMFVQDYIYTLFCKDVNAEVVREFVERFAHFISLLILSWKTSDMMMMMMMIIIWFIDSISIGTVALNLLLNKKFLKSTIIMTIENINNYHKLYNKYNK